MVDSALRRAITGGRPLLLPGVYDALSARLAEQARFQAIYLSGSAVAMTLLGLPDIGLVTATEIVEQARRVTEATTIPLVCDIDTGYGNPLNVGRTVRAMEAAGVSGVQLEDQQFPKRCGHFDGKSVIAQDEMVMKIRAALDARTSADLILIARTDARAVLGLDVAIERAIAYREAGADIIFVEAPDSIEELGRIGKNVPGPLLVNVVEGGRTPQLSFDEYASLGFTVILYPTAAVRAAARTLSHFYRELKNVRSTLHLEHALLGFEERNEVNDLASYITLEKRYATEDEKART